MYIEPIRCDAVARLKSAKPVGQLAKIKTSTKYVGFAFSIHGLGGAELKERYQQYLGREILGMYVFTKLRARNPLTIACLMNFQKTCKASSEEFVYFPFPFFWGVGNVSSCFM